MKHTILHLIIGIFMFVSFAANGMQEKGMEIIQKHRVPVIAATVFGGAYLIGMSYYDYRNKQYEVFTRDNDKSKLKNFLGGAIVAACVGGMVGFCATKIISFYEGYSINMMKFLFGKGMKLSCIRR